jgi:hypothetical protein|tara:strand:- start:2817 stop:4337 length:1521 start_codon:yes stop_codon:yes gene_type:complete
MSLIIQQSPLYLTNPAAQKFIYTISESQGIPLTALSVKYIANVYISNDKSLVTSYDASVRAATLKTTPNNAGVGMFDLRPIIESFVSPDYEGSDEIIAPSLYSNSCYKDMPYTTYNRFPIHIIDRGALAVNSTTWVTVQFYLEYFGADPFYPNQVKIDTGLEVNSQPLFVFNGVLYNEDPLYQYLYGTDFGYDYEQDNYIMINTNSKFLTQAPTTQYARLTDYGTLSFFSMLNSSDFSWTTGNGTSNTVFYVKQILYDSSDSVLGTFRLFANEPTITTAATSGGGAGAYADNWSYSFLMYMGLYPANLTNWLGAGTDWGDNLADISYYTLQAFNDASPTASAISQIYTINIICENSFGYEGIRLTWLNKLGTWDYYTFNQKSVKSVSTKKSTYTQLGGTWNEATYQPAGYKGGKKNFRVNSKEKITLNTDFLNDLESVWIEGIITSPEVYIVNEYSNDDGSGIIKKYVEPVIVTTSNFVRKTKANDKLIQYTIEIERNKDQRQQAI